MIHDITAARKQTEPTSGLAACEHRTVAKDGRIICARIVVGQAEVSPDTCRICPARAVHCTYLRFSLRQTEPHRCITRTGVGDDESPGLRFERAICAAKGIVLDHPRQCAGCALRRRTAEPGAGPARRVAADSTELVADKGKIVSFRHKEGRA